jgi:hypothetical protein
MLFTEICGILNEQELLSKSPFTPLKFSSPSLKLTETEPTSSRERLLESPERARARSTLVKTSPWVVLIKRPEFLDQNNQKPGSYHDDLF